MPKTQMRFRAAKSAKCENLTVFIRFAVHAAEAGMEIKGGAPLIIPGEFSLIGREAFYNS